MKLRLFFCFLVNVFVLGVFAQGGNPFDLKPRLSPEQQKEILQPDSSDASPQKTQNPFDLLRGESAPEKINKPVVVISPAESASPSVPQKNSSESDRQFLFYIVLFDLLLFSILIVSFRSIWTKVYRGVMNDNMLSQFYGERYNNQIMQSVLILYSLFFVNMALFIFLLDKRTEWLNLMPNGTSNLKFYGYIFIVVFLLLVLKHFILRYIGYIFPLKNETGLYNFSIIVFSIAAALILLPLNIGIAFIGEKVTQPLIILSLIALFVLYGLRYLRGFFIANNLISLHKFHFLLYLCTVEIAPPFILYQLFVNN